MYPISSLRSLQRMLPVLAVLVVAVMSVLARLVYAKENANENDMLPNACKNFTLISGNVSAAHAIVLGENHVFQSQTFACLYALVEMLKLGNNFNFFYEGLPVEPEHATPLFKDISTKAVAFRSWDDKDAFMRFVRLPVVAAGANFLLHLESQALSDDKMQQLIVDAQLFYNKKMNEKTVFAVQLQYSSVYELSATLIQQYQLFKSLPHLERELLAGKKSIFKFLFDRHFEEIRKKVAKFCRVVPKNQLVHCILEGLSKTSSHKKRDKSLLKHIQIQLEDNKRVGFFIAGGKHVEAVLPQDRLAVLRFNR